MRSSRAEDDRGVVMVLVAAIIGALLIVAAIVIDLGGARSARAKDQTTADATAAAAAAHVDPTGANNSSACLAAWNYLLSNTSITASPTPSCLAFAGTCVGTTAREVVITRDDYTITFTNPVPDSSDLFTGQPAQAADGAPCRRFGVKLTHTWRYLLKTGSTPVVTSAVGRFAHGPGDVNAPLVITNPHACEALVVSGNSRVTTTSSTGDPGFVAIDSDGALCTSGNKVVVDTTGSAQIVAGGIAMWALATGNTSAAYDPSDVGVGRAIYPAPIESSAPVGRTAVDE